MLAPRSRRRGRKPTRQRGLRPDIQGLRAFAVIAVILDHLLGWPSGGFVGVDIFFVLSGFLITGLLLREHERTGRISFSGFYLRRVKRILPAAALVLALTVAASFLVFNSARTQSTLVDSIWALLFAANWRQAIVGTDYFAASGPESPVQHYWSLAVEEQFYFLWPWLMLALFAVSVRLLRAKGRPRLIAGTAMLALTISSFAWSIFETSTSPTTAYFSTLSRAWELGAGALLACVSPVLTGLPSRIRPYLAWVGLGGMLISLFTINAQTAFPGPAAALPVFSTVLVVAAGTGTAKHHGLYVLTNRAMGYIGDISYSLYLWHFPVIVIGTTLLGHAPQQLGLLALIFTAGAIYAYHLVEDPIRKSGGLGKLKGMRKHVGGGELKVSPRYQMTALSLLAAITAGVVWTAMIPPTQTPTALAPKPQVSSPAEAAVTKTPQLEALQSQIAAALAATEWPETIRTAMDQALTSPQASPDIAPCGMGAVDERKCTWGDRQSEHTAMTIGNSISMTYVEALRSAIGTNGGWKLMSYGMFGCPIVDSANVPAGTMDGCSERLDKTIEAINRVKPDIVFVSGVGSTASAKVQLAKITANTKLIFLPGPPGDADVHACYTKISRPADCVGKTQPNFGAAERSLASDLKAAFVDSSNWFCYQGSCPSFVGANVMKMDARHMTPQYATYIAPVVREYLEQSGIVHLSQVVPSQAR